MPNKRSHIIPFLMFAAFTYAVPVLNVSQLIVYPLKTLFVGGALLYFFSHFKPQISFRFDAVAVLAGVAVFFIWVLPEGLYPQVGQSEFNPYEHTQGVGIPVYFAFRLTGAVLVVPLMEELFWRSFAMRYLISEKYQSVELGKFTWFSFATVSLAFGFTHHRWLVGIVAGMIYAGVLYRTKNLFSPILSHAVTNLILGIYVIQTQKWTLW